MKENTELKSLIKINEKSILYRIKNFFKKLFKRDRIEVLAQNDNTVDVSEKVDERKNAFRETITNIENEENKLLELQKQYKERKIKAKDLTLEQINSLCGLYKQQNEDLRKSNEIRKQKLLEYRKKLQTENYVVRV